MIYNVFSLLRLIFRPLQIYYKKNSIAKILQQKAFTQKASTHKASSSEDAKVNTNRRQFDFG